MKTLFSIVITGTLISNIACAQKIKEADVPVIVKSSFEKQYPKIKTGKWEKENGNYEVEFDQDNIETSVLLNSEGALVETEKEINVTTLSKPIVDYCSKNYPGKKIDEASKIVDAKGIITYEAEINKKDLLFDANGKFIKESND